LGLDRGSYSVKFALVSLGSNGVHGDDLPRGVGDAGARRGSGSHWSSGCGPYTVYCGWITRDGLWPDARLDHCVTPSPFACLHQSHRDR